MGMKILVVGGGGREHALCWRAHKDRPDAEIFCAPGNAGIGDIAQLIHIEPTDLSGLLQWATDNKPDLVIVGPEAPSALGLVDHLATAGIRAFGPSAAASRLEASKAWTCQLLKRCGIPTPKSSAFDNPESAHAYITHRNQPLVIKADGLALGKGVLVCDDAQEAHAAVDKIMVKRLFGESGASVVIQDRCVGPELSVFAVCSGTDFKILGSARDYKRAYNDDNGPNTGGVGAYTPVSDATPVLIKQIEDTIIGPTLDATAAAGSPFTGVLYAGLMLTTDGPIVIEFNVRFGDPEAQVILTTSQGDLVSAIEAAIDGTLDRTVIEPDGSAAVCVVLSSGGYPGSYEAGHRIHGLENLPDNTLVFHAATQRRADGFYTNGGRVLGLVGRGNDVMTARTEAYQIAQQITFRDIQMRTDIAQIEDSKVTTAVVGHST